MNTKSSAVNFSKEDLWTGNFFALTVDTGKQCAELYNTEIVIRRELLTKYFDSLDQPYMPVVYDPNSCARVQAYIVKNGPDPVKQIMFLNALFPDSFLLHWKTLEHGKMISVNMDGTEDILPICLSLSRTPYYCDELFRLDAFSIYI